MTTPSRESRFFQWLPEFNPEGESLAALSGEAIEGTPTPMIQRAAKAWSTPVRELSCEQVRLPTSQEMGLRWLAAPVAVFVRKYPKAEISFYPGDLSIAALRTFPALLERAPEDARAIAEIDFGWMLDHWKRVDPSFAEEVSELLSNAKALCRGHSS
jgi:hypothetical protein